MLLHWNNNTKFNVIITAHLISMIWGILLIEYSLISFAVIGTVCNSLRGVSVCVSVWAQA